MEIRFRDTGDKVKIMTEEMLDTEKLMEYVNIWKKGAYYGIDLGYYSFSFDEKGERLLINRCCSKDILLAEIAKLRCSELLLKLCYNFFNFSL